ncbi:cobyrinate a,c-diamide synthase [Prochlorococcus sp. MIT 1223]|uniref:cobyrinate a,c-diamide synthase n=1 Tax=Prochlorococcus sp. MIT 1223 TaxID=3096217 RepID=UPI002A7646D6|nr:cobyrinate a,c-diamide synthase [Prochlorococcus sp. MIT 1223]
MACIISAPSTGSGKTILSLLLSAWATHNGHKIQTFKVGPDYLDSQLLTAVSKQPCRNLDPILCNRSWVNQSFYNFAGLSQLSLIEGVMGLFDGIGSTKNGSTADVAKQLNLPIVLTINANGQAASIAALIKGFRDEDPNIKLAGVVLNKVNTERHKDLLIEVLDSINVKMLGHLPDSQHLNLPSRHLGLKPAHEIQDLEARINYWVKLADEYLDIRAFEEILKAPRQINNNSFFEQSLNRISKTAIKQYPIAIANDKAFHFRYPETIEFLEASGIQILNWMPTEDQPLPKEAKGLIIPGGFPEKYAEQISKAKQSKGSIKSIFGKYPIYAECGGMLLLGDSLSDINGKNHPMTGLLPFNAQKGHLSIGYRKIHSLRDTIILKGKDHLIGHEFHYWQIKQTLRKASNMSTFDFPWELEGWNMARRKEGWCNEYLHASWIHLHWPSSPNVLTHWLNSIIRADSNP